MNFRKTLRGLAYSTALALALLSFPNPVNSFVNNFAPKNFDNSKTLESIVSNNNNPNNVKLDEGIVEEKQNNNEVNNVFSLYNPYDKAVYKVNVVSRIKTIKEEGVEKKVLVEVPYSESPDLRRLKTTVNNLNSPVKETFYNKANYNLCNKRITSNKTLAEIIESYSSKFGVDENTLYAIVNNESMGLYNNDSKVAVAPMHVTFDTKETLNKKYGLNLNLCNVEDNVYASVLYVKDVLDKAKDFSEKYDYESFPLRIVFASYYAGPGTIDSFVSYVNSFNLKDKSGKKLDGLAEKFLKEKYSEDVFDYAERALIAYTAFKNGSYNLKEVNITSELLENN